jgi:hypothetical protein
MKRFVFAAMVLISGLLAQGCCSNNPSNSTTTCSVTFSTACSAQGTVSGYVVFTGAVKIVKGAAIVVQYSTDNFASTSTTGTVMVNGQGMVAVPFSFQIGLCSNMTLQLRAFQDPNFTGTWASGDAVGRLDGTDNGNATSWTNVPLTTTSTSAGDLIIYMDGTGAQ